MSQPYPHQPLYSTSFCASSFDASMSSNRLRMNGDKTQLLWQQLNKLSVSQLQYCCSPESASQTLSRTSASLSTVSQACPIMFHHSVGRAFFQCRQLRQVTSSARSFRRLSFQSFSDSFCALCKVYLQFFSKATFEMHPILSLIHI